MFRREFLKFMSLIPGVGFLVPETINKPSDEPYNKGFDDKFDKRTPHEAISSNVVITNTDTQSKIYGNGSLRITTFPESGFVGTIEFEVDCENSSFVGDPLKELQNFTKTHNLEIICNGVCYTFNNVSIRTIDLFNSSVYISGF